MANSLLPYIKAVLRYIDGLQIHNAYEDDDFIFIPYNHANLTRMREEIDKRFKGLWIANFIKNIDYSNGLVTIEFVKENEAKEVKKDGKIKYNTTGNNLEECFSSIKTLNKELDRILG